MEGMLAKDFHKLMKSIASFSNNQAEVCHYEENLESFKVEILPNDGFYCGGKFNFEVTLKDYPKSAPSVTCATQIYHPNIDNDNGEICLNLFSEWQETYTLEDCVQGLLFLLYNPNLDDPLSPLFDPEFDNNYDDFAENVRRSLEGGEVDGYTFERNLVEEDKRTCTNDESIHCQTEKVQSASQNDSTDGSDTASNGCEVVNEAIDNTSEANPTTRTPVTELNTALVTESTEANTASVTESTESNTAAVTESTESNTVLVTESTESNAAVVTENTELNTALVTESTETNKETATSNLIEKCEETAIDFILGKVQPHRTEDVVGCPLF